MTKRKSQRLLKEDTIRRFMKLANTQVLAENFMDRTVALEEEEMEPGEEMKMGGEEPAMDMEAGEEGAMDAPAGEADVDEEVVEDIVSAVVDAISNVTGVEASVEAGAEAAAEPAMDAPAEEAGEEMGDAGDEEEAAMRDYAANRDDDEELTVEVVDDEELTEAVLRRVVERLLAQKRN